MPSLFTMESNVEEEAVVGGRSVIWSLVKNYSVDFGLKLHAVEDKGNLCTIETVET